MESQKLKFFLNNRNFSKKRSRSKCKKNGDILQVVNDQIVLNVAKPQIEEDDITTSYTYLTKKDRGSKKRWSDFESEIFYESLECCGCEFSMINILFPDRKRNNLKEKFKKELKANNTRVEDALNNFKKFDSERLMRLKELMKQHANK